MGSHGRSTERSRLLGSHTQRSAVVRTAIVLAAVCVAVCLGSIVVARSPVVSFYGGMFSALLVTAAYFLNVAEPTLTDRRLAWVSIHVVSLIDYCLTFLLTWKYDVSRHAVFSGAIPDILAMTSLTAVNLMLGLYKPTLQKLLQ